MTTSSVFCALDSQRIASLVATAARRICYAAPGIQVAVAEAVCSAAKRMPPTEIAVSLDFNERVIRMGYGHVDAVRALQRAGVVVRNTPGLRAGILIIDDQGFVFAPTSLYLEAEPQSDETPNAIRLSAQQLKEVAIRVSPKAREAAVASAPSEAERERLAAVPLEVGVQAVSAEQFEQVDAALKLAPPVDFDIARRVRVFEPFLQYVEIELRGAAIQRHRVEIPKDLQRIRGAKEIAERLRTTFKLIEEDSKLSSKALEEKLDKIRTSLTRSLGGPRRRVILKAVRPLFDQRIEAFRKELETHQARVKAQLQAKLDKSREQVAKFYLPLIKRNPPDELLGGLLNPKPSEEDFRKWLDSRLQKVFPTADTLVSAMELDVSFKDVTFESLNEKSFLEAVSRAYPDVDWEKPFREFRALGEKSQQGPR